MSDYPCLPPAYFLAIYEDAWERAFSGNKQWAHESTAGGTFSIRRKAFKDIAKDLRGLDDIAMMDNLFRAIASAVRNEAGRRYDVADWHKAVLDFIGELRCIREDAS